QPAASGKKDRVLHRYLKIDMTPMVDLGFLLITFFIFTTTMTENKASEIFVPADGTPSNTAASSTLSVILGKDNKVYVYDGIWEDAVKANRIASTGYNVYTGLGSFIRTKQKLLPQQKEGKD